MTLFGCLSTLLWFLCQLHQEHGSPGYQSVTSGLSCQKKSKEYIPHGHLIIWAHVSDIIKITLRNYFLAPSPLLESMICPLLYPNTPQAIESPDRCLPFPLPRTVVSPQARELQRGLLGEQGRAVMRYSAWGHPCEWQVTNSSVMGENIVLHSKNASLQ